MTMSEPVAMFIALKPDAELGARIDAYKNETRDLVGDQLYLGDPPHLTVFLSVYPDVDALAARWETIHEGLVAPRVRIVGWKVFDADPLTGNTTLVFEIALEDKMRLRAVQSLLIERVSAWRDPEATRSRFGPRFDQLSTEQRRQVLDVGFPYIGAGWEPHFTVASIRPADWPKVWESLRSNPPTGEFTCPTLALYRLEGLEPHLVRRVELPVG
jgi:2'-5' RNA ligase